MDPLVNVYGILPRYHLIDGRATLLLLATFLCRSHLSNAEKHPCKRQMQTQLLSDLSPGTFPPLVPSSLQATQLPHSEACLS